MLNLERNKLTIPSLDVRGCTSLRALLLGINPLEYLPTLAPLVNLIQLSICNLRVTKRGARAAPHEAFSAMPISAEFLVSSTQGWGKLVPWSKEGDQACATGLTLILKSSSSFHPLLASLLASLAGVDGYRKQVVSCERREGGSGVGVPRGLQHLIAMCRAPHVSLDALVALCNVVNGSVALPPATMEVMTSLLLDLVGQHRLEPALALYSLQVLRTIAASSDLAAQQVLFGAWAAGGHGADAAARLHPHRLDEAAKAQDVQCFKVVSAVRALLEADDDAAAAEDKPEVRRGIASSALLLLGDLGFSPKCRARLRRDADLEAHLALLGALPDAHGGEGLCPRSGDGGPCSRGVSYDAGACDAGVAHADGDVDVALTPSRLGSLAKVQLAAVAASYVEGKRGVSPMCLQREAGEDAGGNVQAPVCVEEQAGLVHADGDLTGTQGLQADKLHGHGKLAIPMHSGGGMDAVAEAPAATEERASATSGHRAAAVSPLPRRKVDGGGSIDASTVAGATQAVEGGEDVSRPWYVGRERWWGKLSMAGAARRALVLPLVPLFAVCVCVRARVWCV